MVKDYIHFVNAARILRHHVWYKYKAHSILPHNAQRIDRPENEGRIHVLHVYGRAGGHGSLATRDWGKPRSGRVGVERESGVSQIVGYHLWRPSEDGTPRYSLSVLVDTAPGGEVSSYRFRHSPCDISTLNGISGTLTRPDLAFLGDKVSVYYDESEA